MDRIALVLSCLPQRYEQSVRAFAAEKEIGELRLRLGRECTALSGEREYPLGIRVEREDLQRLFERSTNASPYAVKETLSRGFVSAPGGVRIGFCGTLVSGAGQMKDISSAAIRLPGERRGWGEKWVRPFSSTLLLSPPGCGKTTLLRDMVRLLSEQGERVGLCDDRGEIAAVSGGRAAFDVGRHTDVITGGGRSESALMLLRNMNPTVIAMDELTGEEERDSCLLVSRCGVKLLSTAHAANRRDLESRALYRPLLSEGVFQRLLILDAQHRVREELLS